MSYSFIIKQNPFFDKKYYSIQDDKKEEKKDKKEKDEKNQAISDVIDKLLESF